jgi:peroxisomal 3,2-trans-enoyl-CoA isomerase
VAIIRLNESKKLNALTSDTYFRLSCLMREVAEMDKVSVTVFVGTGWFFSAGADVTMASQGEDTPDKSQ